MVFLGYNRAGKNRGFRASRKFPLMDLIKNFRFKEFLFKEVSSSYNSANKNQLLSGKFFFKTVKQQLKFGKLRQDSKLFEPEK